jgi:membrane-associated phospholipid phosphatase
VRTAILDFELISRLGFTADPSATGDRTISIWHLSLGAGAAPAYLPLARFDRPPVAVFERQLRFMRSYADLRPDRTVEILEQLSTHVPFLASIGWLRPDAKRWTIELLETVVRLAGYVEHRVKHGLACRRPLEYSPQVQPMILTPGHGTLPSGHATEAFAAALVFRRLLATSGHFHGHPSYLWQLMRLAARIAINRTVAGVHFPIDSVAGALLGLTLGEYFVARARGVAEPLPTGSAYRYRSAFFDGAVAANPDIGDRDFRWRDIFDPATEQVKFPGWHPCVQPFNDTSGSNIINITLDQRSLPLEWLWGKALNEWT